MLSEIVATPFSSLICSESGPFPLEAEEKITAFFLKVTTISRIIYICTAKFEIINQLSNNTDVGSQICSMSSFSQEYKLC